VAIMARPILMMRQRVGLARKWTMEDIKRGGRTEIIAEVMIVIENVKKCFEDITRLSLNHEIFGCNQNLHLLREIDVKNACLKIVCVH
jgi:hypothetical protein